MGDRMRAIAAIGTSTTAVLVGVFAIGCSMFWSFVQRTDPGGFITLLILWVPFLVIGGAVAGAIIFAILGAIVELAGLPRASLPVVLALLAGVSFCFAAWRLTQVPSLAVAGGIGGVAAGFIVGLRLAAHDAVVSLRAAEVDRPGRGHGTATRVAGGVLQRRA